MASPAPSPVVAASGEDLRPHAARASQIAEAFTLDSAHMLRRLNEGSGKLGNFFRDLEPLLAHSQPRVGFYLSLRDKPALTQFMVARGLKIIGTISALERRVYGYHQSLTGAIDGAVTELRDLIDGTKGKLAVWTRGLPAVVRERGVGVTELEAEFGQGMARLEELRVAPRGGLGPVTESIERIRAGLATLAERVSAPIEPPPAAQAVQPAVERLAQPADEPIVRGAPPDAEVLLGTFASAAEDEAEIGATIGPATLEQALSLPLPVPTDRSEALPAATLDSAVIATSNFLAVLDQVLTPLSPPPDVPPRDVLRQLMESGDAVVDAVRRTASSGGSSTPPGSSEK